MLSNQMDISAQCKMAGFLFFFSVNTCLRQFHWRLFFSSDPRSHVVVDGDELVEMNLGLGGLSAGISHRG